MSASSFFTRGLLAAAVALAAVSGAAGCDDTPFCFDDCPGETGGGGSTGTGQGGEGGCLLNCGTGGNMQTGGGGQGGGSCTPTNGGNEICDGLDNDCDGFVDDIPGIDYEDLLTCGTCSNNCLQILLNNDPATIDCVPSPNPGTDPGTCVGSCAADYHDLDGNGSCEYYCVGSSTPEATCNALDDDCDGQVDEDVDRCTSTTDCGACGYTCVAAHATTACVNNGQMPCTVLNTQCQIGTCECPDANGDCWWDLDGSYATGCEYSCQLTNGGVEICGDQLDNDCDGMIDGADSDLSGDPQIGVPCYGDPDGICATAAHQGMTACVNGQVQCSGANLLYENQMPELCNGQDDDCDGALDDSPSDAGGACGQSNIFPCSYGTYVCQMGALVCVNAVNPGVESCNGVDDDCDGQIDFTIATGMPPMDATGPCNQYPPPPPGSTSPCQAGMKACVGGSVVCQGSIGPQAPSDACGVDSNCDGVLTNQPDLQSDVANCGMCGNNCYASAVHSIQACVNGMCQFQGCQPGYYDLDGDGTCEYPCTFVQQQEICNNVDDNCDGQTDENVMAPSPVQVCGVSPSSTSPECTSGVSVQCVAGTWQCLFPPGVCNPDCATAAEICDMLDNDCDGIMNENVPNFGQPCASDDGLPAPGHGACRTTGNYVCSGASSTACNAVKANCNTLPGGCAELCDGVDNDCDGSVDEAFTAKGADPMYFVQPAVTQIGANSWVTRYEASRANATTTDPGSGNGYHCTGASCSGVPTAPAGVTLDRTRACSVPDRIPWFNITPIEVEQTCQAMGGFVCPTSTWVTACQAGNSCSWGFNPAGAACQSAASASKYCNLGPTYDFNGGQAGDQDGLLATGSAALQNCWASWGAAGNLYDITGNLREITRSAANAYRLMGGAFNTSSQDGATCGFQFYAVEASFKLYDTGFRCCFSQNPTL